MAIALGNAGVRLAVLGACNTAERDEGGVWTGVAPALVRENVPAVVAMQYKVETHNAAHFISYLYIRVLGGYTIDEAVFEGRQALFMRACQENGGWAKDRDWGVPVLYLRVSDGILFPLPAVNSALSGSVTVNTQIKVREVSGELIGTEIDHILNNRQGEREINTRLEIDTITPDGKVIGTRVGSL